MSEKRERLLSLDAFRGFTIIGMIIVNSPGSWSHVYAPLLHASWHGVSPTDLVFPFFLFIVGVSISLAYSGKPNNKRERAASYQKIGFRVFKIFALGVFLNLWPSFDFSEIRLAGVLQRIAIVFGVCAVLFLTMKWRRQLWVGSAILFGYWLLLTLIPVPLDTVNAGALESGVVARSFGTEVSVTVVASGDSALAGNLEPGTNFSAWVDRAFLPGRLWENTWDPEGLLSTLPAVSTGIFGMLVGSMILGIGDPYRRVSWVFFVGVAALLAGSAWSWIFPINKNLWSSSFVLYAGGWASLCLAALLLLVDVRGYRNWAKVGIAFGSNPVVAYALAGMLTLVFYSGVGPIPRLGEAFMAAGSGLGVPDKLSSLVYALLYVGVIYLPVRWLWKRRIFVRL